jgi:hypothetical protein
VVNFQVIEHRYIAAALTNLCTSSSLTHARDTATTERGEGDERLRDHPRERMTADQASGSDSQSGAKSRRLAVPALFVLALIWGYNWVVMKVGLAYSQPFTFATLRTFLGAVVLFLLLVVLRRPLRPRALGLTAALGLLQTGGSPVWPCGRW